MDIADVANEIEQDAIKVALMNHQAKQNVLSRHFCIDCDIVIPAARLAVVKGCLRCVDCQSIYEHKVR